MFLIPRTRSSWACSFLLIFSALGSWAQVDPAAEVAARVRTLNRAMASTSFGGPALRALAEERATLVRQLIALAPASAAELALPSDLRTQLMAIAPEAVEVAGEWNGVLEEFIEDDFEHRTSRTHWRLRTDAGTYEMYPSATPRAGAGMRVSVSGVRSGTRIAAAGISVSEATAEQCAATTGDQKIAVLLVNMPGKPLDASVTKPAVQQMFFGNASGATADTVNSYWKEASYGKVTSVQGGVFGPYDLGEPFACDQTTAMTAAAVAKADGDVDFSQYSRVVVIFKGPCAWSGLASLGCSTITSPSKGTLPYSVVWLPTVTANVAGHELGHNFGMEHASSEDYGVIPLGPPIQGGVLTDYGDPFDMMASSYTVDGQVIMSHYSAPHKVQLDWLAPGEYLQTRTSGTFTLSPLESNSGVRGLRILREAATDSWLWAEFRQETGSDSKLPLLRAFSNIVPSGGAVNVFDGALVHYEDPAYPSARTRLLDFNPTGIPNKFGDAALAVGKSWSDPYSPLILKVSGKDANGLQLTVRYEEPCAQVTLDPASYQASGGSGTLTITAPDTCSWSASTTNTWIKLNGAASGSGNKAIPITVDPNTGAERQGAVTAARQTTTFLQAGPGPSVLGVTPALATGTSKQFTFEFSDQKGAVDIKTAVMWLGSCEVRALLADYPANPIFLRTGNSLAQVLPGDQQANSACTVFGDGSSAVLNGSQLTITLSVQVPASTEPMTVSAQASSGAETSGQIRVGSWSTSACTYAATPAGQAFASAADSGSISIDTQPGCAWSVQGAPSWVTFGTASSGSGSGQVGFQVSGNPPTLRTATFTVGGIPFTVEQAASSTSGLSFAGSIPQLASGDGWASTITLVNNGASQAQTRLDFYNNGGARLNLPVVSSQSPVATATTAMTLVRNLDPNSSLILAAQDLGSAVGAGQLRTSGNAGGFAIFRHEGLKWEAVVPLETRNEASYTLAFDNKGGVATGVAVANVSTQQAQITVKFRSDAGTLLDTESMSLGPNGHISFMLDNDASSPDTKHVTHDVRGTVEFSTAAAGQISVLGLRSGPIGSRSTLTTLPVLAKTAAGGSLAHVAYGDGWNTTFTITNMGASDTAATLSFFSDAGAPLTVPVAYPQTGATEQQSVITRTVAAGASLIVEARNVGSTTTGWAKLTGNVGGFAIFRNDIYQWEAVVPLEGRDAASYVLAFDNTSSIATGVAVSNVASQPAAVTVIFRDEDGNALDTRTMTLAPLEHKSFMLDNDSRSPDTNHVTHNRRGTVEFVKPAGASSKIAILGLRSAPINSASSLTTLPVLEK